MQITKVTAFFLHWALPEGVLWLSFPSLFWKTSTTQSKFATWEQLIKSSGKWKAGATVMFPWYMFALGGSLLFCPGTKLWLQRFGMKDFQTSEHENSQTGKWKLKNGTKSGNKSRRSLPHAFSLSWNLHHASLFRYQIQSLLEQDLNLCARIKLQEVTGFIRATKQLPTLLYITI